MHAHFSKYSVLTVKMQMQQGVFSEKDEHLRSTLIKLDTIDTDGGQVSLGADDINAIRRSLVESQTLVRDTVDRLRQSQEENERNGRKHRETEARLAKVEMDMEEMLGTCLFFDSGSQDCCGHQWGAAIAHV